MPRNGSGSFTPPAADYPAVASTLIESTKFNNVIDDIGTALTGSVAANGETTITANIPMNSKKFTGLANGSARTDSPALGQVQDGTLNWVDGGGTADVITATYSPAITALVDGQICCVRATAANTTTTPTFAPNGLTARTIVMQGNSALVAGSIKADGHELLLRYDLANTRWELLNPALINISGYAAAVTVADAASDTTTWPMLATSQTGNMAPATDAGLTYNASTGEFKIPGSITTGNVGSVISEMSCAQQNTRTRLREYGWTDLVGLTTNVSNTDSGAITQDDATKSSWKVDMGYGNGTTLNRFSIEYAAAGAATWTNLLTISSAGALTLPSTISATQYTSTIATGTAPLVVASITKVDNLYADKAGMPQNSQSAAYTTVLADANKHILHPTADNNARTFTIDSNANVAYAIGTCITFYNQINTVTIAITTDTMTLAGFGTTGSRTLAAYGMATALKVAATEWVISGTGLS